MLAIRKRREKPTWRCPGEHLLAAYADNRLAGSEKDRVEDHLAGCAYCLDQVAFLARISEIRPPEEVSAALLARVREVESGISAGWRWPAWSWAAAGAAAVLAISVTLWWQQPGGQAPPITLPSAVSQPPRVKPVPHESLERDVRQGPSSALPEVLSPSQGAVVALGSIEFRWTEVPRSLYYEVQLMTDEGSLVWEGRSESASLRAPGNIALNPGRIYYVSVRAHLPEGQSLRSPAVGFQIARSN